MNPLLPRLLLAFALLTPALLADTPVPTPASPPLSTEAVPTELRSEKLEMTSTDTETRAIATGSVVLTGTNLRITCDRLEIIASRLDGNDDTANALDRIQYILATGRVRIRQDDREATCGRAEVFPAEEKVVLTESPVIIDTSTHFVAAGERITLLRGQREVQVDLPRLIGPPVRDLGANPRDTPPPNPSPRNVAPRETAPRETAPRTTTPTN